MNQLVLRAAELSIFPALSIFLGAILALFTRMGPSLRSGVQHFAAGLLFAVIATELLPDIMHERRPVAALIGFASGVALMLTVKWFNEKQKEREESTGILPKALLVSVAVDVLVDGTLIGIGIIAGARQSLLLTVALTIEMLFLGISASTALKRQGVKPVKVFVVNAVFSLSLVSATILGVVALGHLTGNGLEAMLAFGCSALLYLVTEELLVEVHEETDTPLLTAMFFLGFILLPIIEMVN